MEKQKVLSEKEKIGEGPIFTGRTGAQPAQMKKSWKKPELKDVTKEIMAQPFIRFT